jgi:hypothetical protein
VYISYDIFKIEICKKKKHLQKRKGRRGGLPAKPVAGSDRSLGSNAPDGVTCNHKELRETEMDTVRLL